MKVVCISDTHAMEDELTMPSGDLLIHAGDMTNVGALDELMKFNRWLKGLDFEKKVVIPGNHDRTLFKFPDVRQLLTNCDLLIDSYTHYRGFKIYGSPWTPWFGGHYWVWNAHRGPSIASIWQKIPLDTDILITHGPPKGILDHVPRTAEPQGCLDLYKRVLQVKPKLHVFGHLHSQGGQKRYMFASEIMFVNAAVCTESYEPTNEIVVVDI